MRGRDPHQPALRGEEEIDIKADFAPDMQTAETALLFLQYIMCKLRVAGAPVPGGKPTARGGRDALYWPVYNLDMKNPHVNAGPAHADPKDLIASMRSHEAEVMRLLAEIEQLVSEAQA